MDTLSCNWDTAKFLIFSGNVFDNLIYYSHLGPFFVALIIGIFVFSNNRKSLVNKVLLFLTLTFSIWVYFDLILWATEKPHYVMFFWSIMAPIELLFYFLAAYLVYLFLKKSDVSFKIKILSSLFFLPVIIFTHTHYNLSAFDYTNCDLGAFEGVLWKYIYGVEILIIFWIIGFYIKNYKNINKEERKKNLLFVVGVFFLLLLFSLGNFTLIFELDWKYEQYKLFGMPIFVAFLAYLIVKFKAFDIKLLAAQALVVTLIILVGSQFFYVQSLTSRILTGITLILAVGFGWALIKSVKLEVQRKEELQIMSDKLSLANDQLKKLDNAKSEFISIASHQLRTPLTAIKGFVSLLLEGVYGSVDLKVRDALNKVYLSNERMVELVENLLNISRIESGRMEFDFKKWKVDGILNELRDTFFIMAKNKGLSLDFKFPEYSLPEIEIDGTKVREVISNFIDNALKYTKEGGVTVSTQSANMDQKSGESVPSVKITVSDTGLGVPKDELPYLFAKFSRGKDTKRLHVGGTGLGLYVGKSIIEAHHGRVWAESEGDSLGSNFFIEIPVSQEKFKRRERVGEFIKKI